MKSVILSLAMVMGIAAQAAPQIRLLGSHAAPTAQVQALITQNLDVSTYREIGVQMVKVRGNVDHLLLFMHVNGTHRLRMAAIFVDGNLNALRTLQDYRLTPLDQGTQPGSPTTAVCPDPTVQFIAFAPNDDKTEQGVTQDVATAAQQKGLKVMSLLTDQATRQNYLNYMSCPNLIGNFYDGDSNPNEFVTVDGVITSTDMATLNFHLDATNIWVACEAFNDPMLTTMLSTAQSQKFAAGINDLDVGPSDDAAKCAMIAAINGSPMTAAFQSCYTQYDDKSDQWGFQGNGADILGQKTSATN